MDKYEYKIKEDEIKELIKMQEFGEAAEVADTIDWRRVKSVKMLCLVSDIYKKVRRYEDSRDMLLLAYDRHPGGRTIVYSLCELAIKMNDLGHALEYCKEFIQLAPKDPGRYILQYKLYQAQEVGLEERIAVLEELKKRDYREKWAYELALLYHRVGMETRCVEECDELIVWFGEGKYVIKAMELKMQHQPLTPQQQEKYDNRFKKPEPVVEETPVASENDIENAATVRIPAEEIDIQVKPLGLSQCDTINLQAEVAAGLKEYLDKNEPQEENDIDFEEANTAEFMMGVLETSELEFAKESQLAEKMSEEPEQDMEQDTSNDEEEELPAELASVLEEIEEAEDAEKPEVIPEEVYEEEIVREEDILEEPEETVSNVQKPEELDWQAKEMAKVLSVEGDGQISFVVPENVALEKQITGQMNFNDILLEWERMKLELEEKRKENVRQMVLKNTGAMFTEFEASVRDGLLEQLEKGKTMEEILPQAESMATETQEVESPEAEQTAEEEIVEAVEEFEELEEVEDIETAEEEIPEASEDFEELETVDNTETVEEEIAEAVEDYEQLEAEDVTEEPEAEEVEEITEEPEAEEVEEIAEEPETEEAEEIAEEPECEEVEEITEEPEYEEVEEITEEPDAENEDTEDISEEDGESDLQADIAIDVVDEFDETGADKDDSTEDGKDGSTLRSLTKEEKELFAPYIQGRQSKAQLLNALETVSLAAYTGNIVITGREGLDTIGLARNLIRHIQQEDTNFSGKVAKISGNSLNKRNIPEIFEGLVNGALIVQKAEDINEATAKSLYKVLQQETRGIIVVLEGTKRAINTFFDKYSILEPCFNARIDMEALSNEALVAFAKKYARELEYSIDEFGMLALHRVIAERQTSDHAVTILEVKEIMDDAIDSANRKSLGHFFAVLAAKRYDEEDMLIIREKDFM